MRVKPHHPLMELLGQFLFGIENVSRKEQRLMVNRACQEGVKWHEEQTKRIRSWIKDMDGEIRSADGNCPECNEQLFYTIALREFGGHQKDCELKIMLEN